MLLALFGNRMFPMNKQTNKQFFPKLSACFRRVVWIPSHLHTGSLILLNGGETPVNVGNLWVIKESYTKKTDGGTYVGPEHLWRHEFSSRVLLVTVAYFSHLLSNILSTHMVPGVFICWLWRLDYMWSDFVSETLTQFRLTNSFLFLLLQ